MKKYILLLFAVIASLSSCENWNGDPIDFKGEGRYIALNFDALYFDFEGNSSDTYTIEALKAKWEITAVPSWLTIAPRSGGNEDEDLSHITTLTVNATENTSSTDRTGTITIKSTTKGYSYEKKIKVTQYGAEPYIKVINPETNEPFENYYSFEYPESAPFAGAIINVKLKTNIPDKIKVECESSIVTCTYIESQSTIKIAIPKNSDVGGNSFEIDAYNADNEYDNVRFYIYQDGAKYSFTDLKPGYSYLQNSEAPYSGGVFSIPTESNCPDEMSVSAEFVSTYEGLGQSLSVTYDSSSKLIKVNVPKNEYGKERSIRVKMWYGSYESNYESTTFYQLGAGVSNKITVNPETIAVNGGSATITFDCTCDWTLEPRYLSSFPDWLHFNRVAGMGGAGVQIIATCDANTGSSRYCDVTIKPVTGESKSFTITQAAVELTVSKDYFACHNNSFPEGSSFTLTASGKWSIKSADSWLSLSKTSGGAGEHNLDVVCDYKAWNQGLEYRQGNIVIQLDGTSKTVSLMVRQYY